MLSYLSTMFWWSCWMIYYAFVFFSGIVFICSCRPSYSSPCSFLFSMGNRGYDDPHRHTRKEACPFFVLMENWGCHDSHRHTCKKACFLAINASRRMACSDSRCHPAIVPSAVHGALEALYARVCQAAASLHQFCAAHILGTLSER